MSRERVLANKSRSITLIIPSKNFRPAVFKKQYLKQSASHISRSKMSHKTVTSKRATFTKAEREYVKGMVHNLSFKRLSDREITQWLHDEKQIDLDRSTVAKLRNKSEKDAGKWYIGLRDSGAKYIPSIRNV